jgi:hypothetical protein
VWCINCVYLNILSRLKKYIHSRAYIYFKTHEAVCEFNEFFNGHVFVNSKGLFPSFSYLPLIFFHFSSFLFISLHFSSSFPQHSLPHRLSPSLLHYTKIIFFFSICTGVEERALVEYAPYQKFPKLKKRSDMRMGTITEGFPHSLAIIHATQHAYNY